MQNARLPSRHWRGRFVLGVCLISVLTLLGADGRLNAQEQQGGYITQAAARLTRLVNASNNERYKLQDNSFSIGGGWLKQSQTEWVPLYTVQLTAGTDYRFLAAGDNDAKDVDLQVLDSSGKVVAKDDAVNPEAVVNYRPIISGRYTVRIRLYDANNNLPCVCLGIVMVRK